MFDVNHTLLFVSCPPPAEILLVIESTISPDESITLTSTSKSSKKALEKTLKLIFAVSSLPSPSLSDVSVVFIVRVAGEVILAASISTVP